MVNDRSQYWRDRQVNTGSKNLTKIGIHMQKLSLGPIPG